MAEQQLKQEEISKAVDDNDYKGTFLSVMILGGFIIVSWLGVWLLFLSR